jgi:hypothetical protein
MAKRLKLEVGKRYVGSTGRITPRLHEGGEKFRTSWDVEHFGIWRPDGEPSRRGGETESYYGTLIREYVPAKPKKKPTQKRGKA